MATYGPTLPQNQFSLGTQPRIQSTGMLPYLMTQTSTNPVGTAGAKIGTGQAGIQAKAPVTARPVNTISASQSKPIPPAASSTGVFQAGQALPAVGSPEYQQSLANLQRNQTTQQSTATPPPQNNGFFANALNTQQNIAQNGNSTSNSAQQSLMSQANNPNPAAGSISSLQNIAQNQTPAVIQAQQDYNQFAQQNPYMKAAQFNPNVAADVASGRSNLLGQTFAAVSQAKQAAVNNALQGQGQQITAGGEAGQLGLTGQGQQITAANNAGNLGLTQQGQQITAANNVATAAAPVTQFGVLTDPTTGKPISPGMTAGNAAFQGGYIGGQQTAGSNAAGMNVANTAAKGIQGTIQQYIQANPQLNPSDVTFGNSILQWAQGQQLGDPKYQTLANYLNEYISTLAPILGVGGDATNLKTEIAQSFINAKASGQSISDVLNGIGKLADDKLANIVSAGQGGGQVAGPTPSSSSDSTPQSFGQSW